MQLDGRTLLFSMSITLLILVSIIVSIRRSMENTIDGLGWYALSNVSMTVGCILLSLRGTAPDWLSLLVGNTLLVTAGSQYLLAFQQYDKKPESVWMLAWAPGLTLAYLAACTYVVDSQPARVIGMMLALSLVFGAGAVTVIRGSDRTFSRMLTSGSLFLVTAACIARLVAISFSSGEQQTALFGGSSTGIGVFLAGCVVTQTSAVGFILMVNERLRAHLSHLATHDSLTGLLSRGAFLSMAGREILRAQRKNEPFAIALLDVDHFKRINDTYGHQVGDRALESFAAQCVGVLRRSDSMGRYGGEEFIAFLPDAVPSNALMVAERLRAAIEAQSIDSSKGPIAMTCSIGVASAEHCGYDLEQLIAAADQAMYIAKSGGRNRVCQAQRPETPSVTVAATVTASSGRVERAEPALA